MLDDVLDATVWPLPQQQREAMAKRRIGLGFTGLGDALLELNLRYDSEDGRPSRGDRARDCIAAYVASVEIAKEKGAFPLFDADRYLAAPSFASRLPSTCSRPSARTASATATSCRSRPPAPSRSRSPTTRERHRASVLVAVHAQEAHARRHDEGVLRRGSCLPAVEARARHRRRRDARDFDAGERSARRVWSDADGKRYAMLPSHFVTALEMSALDHMRMSAAVQPWVDSAISKTVNVPADYPFADFEDLYLRGWKAGLKGITTYRPNAVLGAVLRCAEAARDERGSRPDRPRPADTARGDRGAPACEPALAGPAGAPERQPVLDVRRASSARRLRGVHRPHRERQPCPFEVWVNGAEQPRGLGAIAKTLSMDMRADDRRWLDMKLSRCGARRRRRFRSRDAA